MPDRDNDMLLAQEYLQLQKTIEDFGGRALTIKAWSVTFSAAGLGLAYQQTNPKLLLIAAFSALVFWAVETVWKIHSRAFYPRIIQIEEYFAGRKVTKAAAFAPFQIHRSWRQSFEAKAGPMRRLIAPFFLFDGKAGEAGETLLQRMAVPFYAGVFLPHLLIAVAGVVLYFYSPPRTPGPPPLASIEIARPQR